MRKSYCFLAVFLMAALFSFSATAQTITIKGNVKNSSNKENVPAVTIAVKGTNDKTYTDPNGDFSIRVAKLPVTLEISSIGYEPKEVTVTEVSKPVDIELVVVAIPGTDVIVYSTQRAPQRILEAPVTVERMSSVNLRSIPAPSYYEAISNLKGVDMHTASLTFRTVTTRGFVKSGNTRMNQLIDGMDNQAPGLNFSVGNIIGLTELDVDNIELLSGASSALYGSGGMNGTLLLTSKNPFKYQGLSFNVKQGIMHTDGKQRSPAPFYDWSFRYAKNIKDKIAFKISMQLTKGSDWQADDYRNTDRSGILSKVVAGDRTSPGYDGVNVYGDETNANIFLAAPAIRDAINAQVLGQTGVNLMTNANAYFGAQGNPVYPSNAQLSGFIGLFPAALQPAVQSWLPFYNAVKGNYIPSNSIVSRTGYEEKTLVDYNTLNVKGTFGFHWKITPSTEASWTSYLGTGTTVYTGADRYSLRNFKMAQHKLEVKAKNWFIRGYTTQENAGEAYNGTVLGRLLNEYWKPSSTAWYPQYIGTFSEAIRQGNGALSVANAHIAARNFADVGRLLPGTSQFEAGKLAVRSQAIPSGAKFLDKSDLWAGEGQLNLSDIAGFSDKLEVITGIQYKQYVLNSQGTIFNDATGPIKVSETGGYIQLKKKLGELVTLTAAGRYDKHKNYDGRFTPRFTGTLKVAKDNYIRVSYQQAYRFPTNQDQYINLNVGSGILIGHLNEFKALYNYTDGSNIIPPFIIKQIYTAASVIAARAALNPGLLVVADWKDVKPETVSSNEIGYKGIISKKLSIDAYAYISRYRDFLSSVAVGQSNQPVGSATVTDLLDPTKTRNLSYAQNTPGVVKAYGWGLSLEYQPVKNYFLYGNIFSDKLSNIPDGFISYFNAPKYRFNVGLRNEKVWKGLGFNAIVKWQDENFYEGTFITGTLPSFAWVDAQVSWRPANTKSVFRIGGTNVANKYARTGFGSPYVGGLYYVSYGYNIF